MAKRLVEVGTSVISDSRPESLSDEELSEFVLRALRSIDTNRLPVRGCLLFATANWCRKRSQIPAEVRQHFRQRLGYDVPLIGGSMAGFYCSTEQNPKISQGLMLIAICSMDFSITVGHLREPHKLSAHERTQKLCEFARDLSKRAGVRLGASANKSLFGIFPGVISDQSGTNRAFYDNELHGEILAAFQHRYQIVGASAADSSEPTTGFQFANDLCLESSLALALVETDLSTAALTGHGFTPYDNLRVSVDSLADGEKSGYQVTKLDGQKPSERLRQLRELMPASSQRIVFGLPCGDDFNAIRPLGQINTPTDILRLKRKVSVGDRLYVLTSSPTRMLQATASLLEGVLKTANAEVQDLLMILGFSCVGRMTDYRVENPNWEEEIESLRETYLGIPLIWALSAGEFGIDELRRTRANNMSISVLCLTNNYSWRSGIRPLQNKLIAAASRLTLCESPKQVMEIALKGALRAGARGGQICLVDHKLQRILGKDHGYATRVPGSRENWVKVAALTDREAPNEGGGKFPLHLRDQSMSVAPALGLQLEFEPESLSETDADREDILTLVVRTLRAVFIPDSTLPEYHCDQAAVTAGNLKCQLVIPLVGSGGRAIASLQISLAEQSFLDRETLALWVSYAQKVASNLERAQEAEERAILAQIAKLGNRIVQSPIDPDSSLYAWCKEYLDMVVRLLEADGGHIRILQKGITGDEYHLVNATGFLGDLLTNTRRFIREGDGSYNEGFLSRGGLVLNTHRQCAEVTKDVKANENEERFGEALREKLNQVQSVATLPLYDREPSQEQVLGSFIIYSQREYLFSERRERIARAAAARAGAILRTKRAEFDRANLDRLKMSLDIARGRAEVERNWMLDSLTAVSKGSAEERLRDLLERVTKFAMADVGSVFIWNEETERLILHTAYNWHDGGHSEGKAAYRIGESWTGNIALQDEEVTLLKSSDWRPQYRNKLYSEMIPPEHRQAYEGSEISFGMRLAADDNLVGVMTLVYYHGEVGEEATKDVALKESLKLFTHFITLCVEAVQRELEQRRIRHFLKTRKAVANQIIHAALSPRHGWQAVADVLRDHFMVERVNFYRVLSNNKLQLKWSSPPSDRSDVPEFEPVEPFGSLGDIVLRHEDVIIKSPRDPRLGNWPIQEGIRTLYATPIAYTGGDVRGVAVYINRLMTADHPFEFFDDVERDAAAYLNLPIAAALEQLDRTREFEELTQKLVTATKIGTSGLFGSIVMHRIMTPFANIRVAIDWLLLHLDSPEEERIEYLHSIGQHYAEAVKIIDKAEHQVKLGVQLMSLNTVVREALRAIEQELSTDGIELDLRNSLRVTVRVNLWSIVEALVNLLSNAVEAMKKVQVRQLTVTTELSPDKTLACVYIHNTGRLIREKQIANFFQPEYTTKKGADHRGHGIPLAKKAIEIMGGRLELKPHSKGGIEAFVSLPVAGTSPKASAKGDVL